MSEAWKGSEEHSKLRFLGPEPLVFKKMFLIIMYVTPQFIATF